VLSLVAVLTCVALSRATPVPAEVVARAAAPVRSPEASALRDGLSLDPNLATAGDFDLLPGVGPSLAARIIENRREKGPFLKLDDLRRVRGIGQKTLQKLAPFMRFGPRSSPSR